MTKLTGVQLRMKRYRGMSLKQALGDIKGQQAVRKAQKKLKRLGIKVSGGNYPSYKGA